MRNPKLAFYRRRASRNKRIAHGMDVAMYALLALLCWAFPVHPLFMATIIVMAWYGRDQ